MVFVVLVWVWLLGFLLVCCLIMFRVVSFWGC